MENYRFYAMLSDCRHCPYSALRSGNECASSFKVDRSDGSYCCLLGVVLFLGKGNRKPGCKKISKSQPKWAKLAHFCWLFDNYSDEKNGASPVDASLATKLEIYLGYTNSSGFSRAIEHFLLPCLFGTKTPTFTVNQASGRERVSSTFSSNPPNRD